MARGKNDTRPDRVEYRVWPEPGQSGLSPTLLTLYAARGPRGCRSLLSPRRVALSSKANRYAHQLPVGVRWSIIDASTTPPYISSIRLSLLSAFPSIRPMSLKHPSPTDDDPSIKKRARINHDESRDAVDDGSGSDYDSDPEEDAYILRAAHEMATQAPTAGSVREAGSISKVILVQFMCHRHQVVELGPQINFVIGHNGSGKSAVLTAITLVLGAKATATNRGSSLKSFIREGQSKAEVTLHLTNRGDEAFKPEIYGDEIIIERSISKDGTSGYKIKASRDHRTVSTKRETLQTILDHFMIQADNPLNVLNQDAAKRFLNASSSKQKYEFFIRGTQLQQLTDEYEEINANIVMSKTLLDKKREDLPELYERAKSAQKTMKELEEASSAQDKISTLQHELTWIYVAEAQKQLESAQSELEKEERILPKYEAKVAETIARIAKLSDEISAIEARKAGRNDDVLDAQRVELTKKIRQRVEQIKAMNSEIRDSDTALKKVEGEISTQTKLIAEENAKSLRNSDSSRKQTIDQISQLSTEIDEFQASLFKAQHDMNQANDSVKSAKEHVNACHVELKRLTSEFELTQGRLREYENGRKDRILLFGRSADKLKSAIENNQGWVEKPIGPLGYYIQVKDKAWQPVIETVLSGSLNSYLVTNERDERLLRDLMARCQCKSPIIRSRRDLFDYSHGEPGEDYFTIFRALSFQDEYVKRALINDLRIEKTILVNHRRDGDPIMSQEADLRPNIESCYTRDGYRVGGIQGGKQSFGLTMYPGPPRLTRDDGSFSTELKQQAIELQAAIDNQRNLLSAAEAQARRSNEQVATAKRDERQLRDRLRKAQNTKASLQDDLDQNASSSVSALEDLKRELESERRKLFDQTKELVRQKEHLSTELGSIKTELEALQHQINNRQQEEEALNVELTQKITDKFTANEALKHFQDSLDRQIVKISQAKAAFEAASAELPKMIAQAKQITGSEEIVATTRPREKIISDLQELTKIVKQTESRHGTSLEEIENRCHDATTRYFKADKQIKEQSKSLKVLKMALALRKDRWIRFRTHIAVRAKMKFVTHLSKRGYTGKLNFNHSTQRLEIQVNTSEQDSTQGKLKDPKALSGGEKSFSTISLLLTLWDAINCPIRCLDEFDVFMDEVNRRIAVRMMIDSAKEANDVQYVFITPNGLSFIQTGPETKIIKMLDPTRNHGTLAAGQE